MPTLLLIRHGENDYVKTGKMAGRIPGVHLNERGKKQAEALGEALKDVPIKAIYASPLERAMETVHPIADSHKLKINQEPDLMDTLIGKWQGRSWKILRLTKAWKIVQNAPSRFRFPDGESFPECQMRIVNVLERVIQKHNKPQDVIAVVFHADPIKLAVAHFLGMPLDHFQRLSCDTGSLTALHVSESNANLIKLNQRPPFDFLPNKK
ncbi:MAG: histidine phosphatase family protein [Anaerolineales bacterium]|nr:histidine phosphatase family protein [Anaerolineales bacterium]MBX3038651.1 histidine phosphatase family protein [Anaerolineales bacterium]